MRQLLKVKDSYNINRLSIVAATAALEDYAWMQQNVAKIRATRTRLTAALRAFGYVVYDSHTNFVLAVSPGLTNNWYITVSRIKECWCAIFPRPISQTAYASLSARTKKLTPC